MYYVWLKISILKLQQWNNHGYDVAKIFGAKFDIISPVWFQVLQKGKNKYEIGGLHDIDAEWMRDVRKTGGGKKSKLPDFCSTAISVSLREEKEKGKVSDFRHLSKNKINANESVYFLSSTACNVRAFQ